MRHHQTIIPIPVVLVFLAIVAFIFYFSRESRVKRALRKARGKRIGDFVDGDSGKISGKVVFAGKTLRAPLSGRRCAYYHVVVEAQSSGGKGGFWHELVNEQQKGDVVLSDGSQYALVEFTEAECHLVPDANYSSGFLEDATPHLERFLSRHGHSSTNLLGLNRTLRYKEGILEENESFVVAGKGRWSETKAHDLKIPSPRILVMTSGEDGWIYISDDPDATTTG